MSWRNAEKIEFLGGRRNNSGLPQAKETHTLNKMVCSLLGRQLKK